MWQFIIWIIVILMFIIISILIYSGLFSKIEIKKKKIGPFTLVYEEHKGAYKGTSKIHNKIYYTLLKNHNIETYKGFGIYYDNPKKVPTEKLRSIAGCILEKSDYNKISYLKKEGFKIKDIPIKNSVIVEFPYRNFISIIIGVIRVYPKFEKYIKQNKLNEGLMMEIYDVPSKKIIYMMV